MAENCAWSITRSTWRTTDLDLLGPPPLPGAARTIAEAVDAMRMAVAVLENIVVGVVAVALKSLQQSKQEVKKSMSTQGTRKVRKEGKAGHRGN